MYCSYLNVSVGGVAGGSMRGKVLESSVRPEGDVFAARCMSSRTGQVSITVQNNLLIPDRGGTSQPTACQTQPRSWSRGEEMQMRTNLARSRSDGSASGKRCHP